ncbi:MAG: hypothetical protein ACR2KP_17085 [Egibacteraceae bacterium]
METYVVRIWRPATAEAAQLNSLHGLVQRIGSDEEQPFADEAQLLALLRVAPAPLQR